MVVEAAVAAEVVAVAAQARLTRRCRRCADWPTAVGYQRSGQSLSVAQRTDATARPHRRGSSSARAVLLRPEPVERLSGPWPHRRSTRRRHSATLSKTVPNARGSALEAASPTRSVSSLAADDEMTEGPRLAEALLRFAVSRLPPADEQVDREAPRA